MPIDGTGNANLDRRLAAILAADVAGYSALMGADEERTVGDLKGHQSVILPMISSFGGRLIDTAGDGILAEFSSVLNAVKCALAIQETMAERNGTIDPARRMHFRIGINQGDVVFDEARIYGDGVNVAARLESIAEPGGICISGKVFDEIHGKIDLPCQDIGAQQLKNIAEPVRVYRVELRNVSSADPAVFSQRRDALLPLLGRPSIVVLPFTNLSSDPDQEYFADGMVEDIITALSRFRWLFVIARNSSFTYKGRVIDVKQAGRELGVRYVLEGSIRKAGNRVRIAARLIDTPSGAHIWADKYDRELDDIFKIQDEVTINIVAALAPEVTAAEISRAHQQRNISVSAWDAYLRALPLMRQHTKAAWDDAVKLLKRAIDLAPDFAAAYARLSACHTQAAYFGWEGRASKSVVEALELARKAEVLDPNEPLGFDALASAYQFAGENRNAETAARRAIELSPTCTAAYGTLITVLSFLGRSDEALEVFARSERTSPRDLDRSSRLMGLAAAYFVAENYDEAIAAAKQYTKLRPNWYGGYVTLAASLALSGRVEEAQQASRRILELIPHFTLARARQRPMFSRESDAQRLFEGLGLAGIPQ